VEESQEDLVSVGITLSAETGGQPNYKEDEEETEKEVHNTLHEY
jgi:hypothetical protein